MPVHIEITYFKRSGKYYTEGEVDVPGPHFHDAVAQLRAMLDAGDYPGLVKGCSEFDVHARVFTEFGPLPFLIVRGRHAQEQ